MVKLLSVNLGRMLLLCCLLFTASSKATLLFSQDPLAFPSPVASGPVSLGVPRVLDNFTLSSDSELTQIDFWTFESSAFNVISNVFDIAIYQDLGAASLGTPIWSSVASTAANEITKEFNPVTQLFEHTLLLSTPQSLSAGNYYFQVAAAANNTIGGTPPPVGLAPVGWQSSAGSTGTPPVFLLANNQVMTISPNANMAFSLTGNVIQTIPSPSTLWLIVFVLMGYLTKAANIRLPIPD